MTDERNDIAELYNNYGFEYRQDFAELGLMVFTITQGVFDNAIIVKLINSCECEKIEFQLKQLGFHVKVELFTSLKEIELDLFKGFFSVNKTKASFKKDYDKHIRNITNSFPTKDISYRYIHSSYYKDNTSYAPGENNILKDIKLEINIFGPKLILIEAPAGFGKTCTAYEVGQLISEQDDEHLVLFAELSRDRHAKIFNHVLQRELARSFPSVSPSLVSKEIKSGKIIVILDGFDELLNEREDEKFQFEKSQAMLETIGDILKLNAKVILTTRKTAILQGDDFDEWIGRNTEQFDFTRYSLKEPSAWNWLSHERSQQLESNKINIKNLSNPVLLTFLKFISDDQFQEVLETPDSIVDKYFNLILNREKERQTLKLDIDEQSSLLQRLAHYMVMSNFTKTTKENIINYFSISELELIEECRSRYNADIQPTFEEMLEKLSNHALLDRSGIDEKIGFINDFVLGHFVGVDLLKSTQEWLADSIFVESVVNAYSSRTKERRNEVWEKLQDSIAFLNEDERIRFELVLLDQATGFYNNSQFKEITFDTDSLFAEGKVTDCYFYDCTFGNCTIDFSVFSNNTFISCSFYNCKAIGMNLSNEFISPVFDEKSKLAFASCMNPIVQQANHIREEDQVKSYILEKFWPIGKETITFTHRPLFIFFRGSPYSSQDISTAIDDFKRSGIITSAKRKNWVGLDISGQNIQQIKDILGR